RITLLAAWTAVAATVLAAPLGASSSFPEKIALPDGFRPEGIAIGKGHNFYVGSIPTGAIWGGPENGGGGDQQRGGHRALFDRGRVPPRAPVRRRWRDRQGLRLQRAHRRSARHVHVLHAHRSGTDVRERRRGRAGRRLLHRLDPAVLYRVSGGQVTAIPLTGAIIYGPGNNANGIDTTPNGKTLIIVQTNVGKLFTVNRRTGVTREIVLNEPVTNGDAILLDGRRRCSSYGIGKTRSPSSSSTSGSRQGPLSRI